MHVLQYKKTALKYERPRVMLICINRSRALRNSLKHDMIIFTLYNVIVGV
jgi:hypothetical protein